MITRQDIIDFYEQYKKNLDEEEDLLETMSNLDSEKVWIKNVANRKKRFKELYKENMNLLNRFCFDLLENSNLLNPEAAKELLNQCEIYGIAGYIDSIAGVEMARVLADYYRDTDNIDNYIAATHLQSMYCLNYANKKGIYHGIECAKREIQFLDRYFEFENEKTRKYLLKSLFNYCVGLENSISISNNVDEEYIETLQLEILEAAKKAIEFFSDERVRKLDGDTIDFDLCVDSIYSLVISNTICEIGLKGKLNQELIDIATEYIRKSYDKMVETTDEKDYSDDVVCTYLVCMYRTEQISYAEFVHRYFQFCKFVVEEEKDMYRNSADENIIFSRYFKVVTSKLPHLLQYLDVSTMPKDVYENFVMFTIDSFMDLLDWFPHMKNTSRINTIIVQASFEIVKYLPTNVSPYLFLLKVVVNRDENAMLNAVLVRKLSLAILESIFRNKPELLIGILDTKNIVEVLDKQEEMRAKITFASLIYDIGKINYTKLISKETRMLLPNEKEMIKNHTLEGYNITKGIPTFDDYTDIILGHHKSYDGLSGYPSDFDNTKSKDRIILDIIKICDCIEASSDELGRIYKKSHNAYEIHDEFLNGSGTEYNPELVNLLITDKKLQKELNKYCISGREKVYYETYYEFFKDKKKERPREEMQFTGFTNSAPNCMHNMVIDLYKDTIETTYYGANSVINERISCGFKEFVKEKLMPITHEDDHHKLRMLLNYGGLSDKINTNNGSFEIEVRVLVRDEWRWHRIQFVVVEELHGIPQKIMVGMDDLDEECRRRHQVLVALEKAKEEAKQADSAKSMFISNISHEIRTPMNAIVGMVEIMLREDMPENQKGYLMNIRNSGNALLSIINDILDFSKMESGKLEIVEDEYEMMSLLNDLGIIFLNRIGEKAVELIFDIDKKIPELLYGDVVRIRQVIINIMNNAIKFTDSGMVKLTIKVLSVVNDMIELGFYIKDTGIGIRKEEIPKLFGAFQQVDIKRNRQLEGTGLGLVISKQLVELMGGSISVDSEYGKGTEFFFTIEQRVISNKLAVDINDENKVDIKVGGYFSNHYIENQVSELCDMYCIPYVNLIENKNENVSLVLCEGIYLNHVKEIYSDTNVRICVIQNPMMESIKDNNVRVVNKPIYSVNFCHFINNEKDKVTDVSSDQFMDFIAPNAKVLIVDDTEMNLTVAKGLLQPLQLQIDTAENGKTAIDMIQRKHYDLVFMDHKMPVMDGIEATELIRNIDGDYYKEVPIIALTANAVLEARESFVKAGMNDFVAKPIELKNICGKIKKYLPKEMILKRNTSDVANTSFDDRYIPEIKGIDIQEGIKNSGSIELFSTLLRDYYQLIDIKTKKVREFLAEGDIHNYTIEVHALKSTSRMIGALNLSDKFRQLEAWGDAGLVEDIMNETPKVLESFEAYKEYLKDFVENLDKQKTTDKQEVSIDEIIEILEAMGAAMKDCDLDMMDSCMSRLDGCSIPNRISSHVEKLRLLVADFNMEEIVKITEEMVKLLRKKV